MYLPRMGQAIIINNVAAEMPGSLADADALQAAYKDVGFDVYSYSDCTIEVSAYVESSLYRHGISFTMSARQKLSSIFYLKNCCHEFFSHY